MNNWRYWLHRSSWVEIIVKNSARHGYDWLKNGYLLLAECSSSPSDGKSIWSFIFQIFQVHYVHISPEGTHICQGFRTTHSTQICWCLSSWFENDAGVAYCAFVALEAKWILKIFKNCLLSLRCEYLEELWPLQNGYTIRIHHPMDTRHWYMTWQITSFQFAVNGKKSIVTACRDGLDKARVCLFWADRRDYAIPKRIRCWYQICLTNIFRFRQRDVKKDAEFCC